MYIPPTLSNKPLCFSGSSARKSRLSVLSEQCLPLIFRTPPPFSLSVSIAEWLLRCIQTWKEETTLRRARKGTASKISGVKTELPVWMWSRTGTEEASDPVAYFSKSFILVKNVISFSLAFTLPLLCVCARCAHMCAWYLSVFA